MGYVLLVPDHVVPAGLVHVVVVGPLYDGLLLERHKLRVSVESPSSLDDTACKVTQPDGCSFNVGMVQTHYHSHDRRRVDRVFPGRFSQDHLADSDWDLSRDKGCYFFKQLILRFVLGSLGNDDDGLNVEPANDDVVFG